MPLTDFNLTGVFWAAVASMAVRFIWYGPIFGNEWRELVGLTKKDPEEEKEKGMAKTYVISFIAALVTAYFLAVLVNLFGAVTFVGGAKVGFFAWLGFVATTHLVHFLYDGKPLNLYKITAGHHLAEFLVMGAILGII